MTDHILSDRKVQVEYLYWDMSLGKGIDDLIMENPDYIKHLRKTDKFAWDYNYLKVTKEISERENIAARSVSSDKYEMYIKELFWDKAFPSV